MSRWSGIPNILSNHFIFPHFQVNLGGEYAHIKVSVPIPEPSEKAPAKSAPKEKKTEEKKEEKGEGSEEKGEGSEEKGEGSEEKGEGSEDAKDGAEEQKTESGEESSAVVAEDKPEEKPSARFLAVQKGRKVNDDIVGFEVSEEAREEEEEEEVKEETKEEEPKEEPKDEEPKEEEPKEEEPKEEEKAKEEEPKEEEAKEEEKEDGDSSLLSTLKSEAADVGVPGFWFVTSFFVHTFTAPSRSSHVSEAVYSVH